MRRKDKGKSGRCERENNVGGRTTRRREAERKEKRGGGRGRRESWINVLALTCPSTGGDRGTANSVGSCSRQAAGLANAQRSASLRPNARVRQRSALAIKQQTRARTDCFFFPHFPCAPSYPFFPAAAALVGFELRKFSPIRTCPANARNFILSTYLAKSGYFLLFSLRH